MMLRSGKVAVKRPKNSYTKGNETKNSDFISKLPDDVLTKIQALLSEAEATRTRVLSHRWNDVWAFLPSLHFVVPSQKVRNFYDSVDQTLAVRGGLPIQKFFLDCSQICYYNRVYEWLRIVVSGEVQEIVLWFPYYDRVRVRFCWDLFKTCKTLVALTLKGGFMLHVPKSELLFPCLKKMDLVSVVYSGEKSLTNLLSGCPGLEELFMERHVIGDFLHSFKVSSPSLKKLRITFSQNDITAEPEDYVMIDAPNLEYICIEDRTSIYSFTKPMSIVEAHIDVSTSALEIISLFSFAKILTLTSSTIRDLSKFKGLIPRMFPNLVKLVVGIHSSWHLDSLWILLNNTSKLEYLTFSEGLLFARLLWNPPVHAPACLRFQVKEIIIHNQEAIIDEEFSFIGYLLKHSNSLERFTLNAHDIHPKGREKVMNFQRGSKSCRIEFI